MAEDGQLSVNRLPSDLHVKMDSLIKSREALELEASPRTSSQEPEAEQPSPKTANLMAEAIESQVRPGMAGGARPPSLTCQLTEPLFTLRPLCPANTPAHNSADAPPRSV